MNEEQFIELCRHLNNSIMKFREEQKKIRENQDINKNETINIPTLSIEIDVDYIIDESNGFIETDKEEIKELFEKVFNQACNIKNYLYRIEQFKSQIRNILKNNPNDNEELSYACSMFSFIHKSLTISMEKSLQLTEKVINMGKTK